VAMAVVLFPAVDETPALRPAALEKLAHLGVTAVALVRDGSTAGLVLEGWAFDPARAAEAACVATGMCDGVRTLRPLAELAVSPATFEGGVT
jgi:hypothetical protein